MIEEQTLYEIKTVSMGDLYVAASDFNNVTNIALKVLEYQVKEMKDAYKKAKKENKYIDYYIRYFMLLKLTPIERQISQIIIKKSVYINK